MALESIDVDPGTGGSKRPVAVDTAASVDIQVVKIALGADGAMDNLVDSGQQAMAASLPVVIASDQSAVPIAGAGTAGTADAGVVTIQGIASMTAVQVDTRRLNGNAIELGNGIVGTGTQRVTLASDSTGQVKLAAGSATIGALTANQSVNNAQINGVAPLMGNGASGTGAQRVTIASDSTGQIIALGNVAHDGVASGNPVRVAGKAKAAAPTDVSADGDVVDLWALRNGALATALTAAGALIGGDASNGLDVDVTRLPALAAGSALVGRVNPEPQTANGLSISRVLSGASTNATSVKASAGQVYSIYAHNLNAAVRYLKLYNKASSPTVGTDTPVLTLPIPGNTAGAGFVLDTGGMGIAFATGIALAITTGVADADAGAVAANDIVVNILYK